MLRNLLVALSVLGLAGSSVAEEFSVSLSASATEPAVNHVAELGGENFSVYLWLTCSVGSGASAFEGVVSTTYTITDFEVLNGLLAGTSTPEHPQVMLEDCPSGPFLIGRWDLSNEAQATSGSVCLGLTGWEGPACTVVGCSTLAGIQDAIAGVTGFAVGESSPCSADNGCTED